MMPDDDGFGPPWLARLFGGFMILCLGGGFVALVLTGWRIDWPDGDGDVLAGEWTGPYERAMDDGFATRDAAVTLWATIGWALFHEGRYGVVVGRDDWLFTVEEFEQPPDADAIVAEKRTQVVAVQQRLAEAGVRLVVVLVPDKSRLYAEKLDGLARRPQHAGRYQAFRTALLDAGIAAPDLLAPLAAARPATATHMRTDTHWSPAGAMIVAEAVAAVVEDLPDPPPSLHRARFVTEVAAVAGHDGDLLRYLPLGGLRTVLLGDLEPLEQHRTRPAAGRGDLVDASGDGDLGSLLFDEVAIPAVLVGTSFSAMDEWNFDGALKQALGMDVLNLADEGGGPMAPMAAYLAGDALRDSPPEIVIWEIPERYLPVDYDLPEDAFAPAAPAPTAEPSAQTSAQTTARPAAQPAD